MKTRVDPKKTTRVCHLSQERERGTEKGEDALPLPYLRGSYLQQSS